MSNRKVLIAILGRSSPKDGEYRKVTYLFPSGARSTPTAFSGWALREHVKPDAMIVLGTSGSMWPFLLLDAVAQSDQAERQLDELVKSYENHAATQQQLDVLSPYLGRYLAMDVTLQIVPAGRTQAEQLSLLAAVARHIREGDKVTLDLTHGFRHQPILLVSAGGQEPEWPGYRRGMPSRQAWYPSAPSVPGRSRRTDDRGEDFPESRSKTLLSGRKCLTISIFGRKPFYWVLVENKILRSKTGYFFWG